MHRQHHIEAFVLLLVVALLAALGFALWQQQHSQDSGAAERPSCRPVQVRARKCGPASFRAGGDGPAWEWTPGRGFAF